MRRITQFLLLLTFTTTAAGLAVDGVIEIDQASAVAGGVSPGDAPGFPVSLTAAGSYRLTGNLDVSGEPSPQNTTAIEILASFVTLDLNGFSLLGNTVCTGSPVTSCAPLGTGDGVTSRDHNFVRIENGMVRGFGDAGIDGGNATVDRVQAFSNGTRGIALHNGGLVSDSAAGGNGARGIMGLGAIIASSRALENGSVGIYANPGEIRDCEAVHNGSSGITVVDGLVSGSISRGNVSTAIIATRSGYTSNNASGTGPISGGFSLGRNVCNAALCP
jgi:hypothetical protein